jgi:CheY-like chemotaxis protein
VILERLTSGDVNRAIGLYLRHAYDDAGEREARRPAFEDALPLQQVLGRFIDETPADRDANRSFALRLGSRDYPHMKFAVWEAYYRDEFVFAVDCHDGFRFDTASPDYAEWVALKNRNRSRKLRIEEAWYGAGLPTLRRLKESALSRSDFIREFRGLEILLVDDDPDAAGLTTVILNAFGFQCRVVASVADALAYIAEPSSQCGLALVDIVLCDGSAREIVDALRAEPRTQDVPIVLQSAMDEQAVPALGHDLYLRKPFSAAELTGAVEEMIRRKHDGHTVFLHRRRRGAE